MSAMQIPTGSWKAVPIAWPGGVTPDGDKVPNCDKPCYRIEGPDGWNGWWYAWGGERKAVLEFVRWLFPEALLSVEETICSFPRISK